MLFKAGRYTLSLTARDTAVADVVLRYEGDQKFSVIKVRHDIPVGTYIVIERQYGQGISEGTEQGS